MTKEELVKLYKNKKMSWEQISQKTGVPESTLRYKARKWGIPSRTKAEAQELFLKNHDHQRVGMVHSDESKNAISDSNMKFWETQDGSKLKKRISSLKKKEWNKKNEDLKASIIENMNTAAKERQGKGSVLEEKLAEFLNKKNFKVEVRTKDYTPGRKFEVDMVLPDYNLVIEIDGPMHFKKIYNDETLKKRIEQDKAKNDILLSEGILTVLRVHKVSKSIHLSTLKRIYAKIESIINDSSAHNTVQILEV